MSVNERKWKMNKKRQCERELNEMNEWMLVTTLSSRLMWKREWWGGANTSDNYVNNWLNVSKIGVNINSKMIPLVFHSVYEVGGHCRFKKCITRRLYFYAMLTTSRPAFKDQKIMFLFKTCHFISSTCSYLM